MLHSAGGSGVHEAWHARDPALHQLNAGLNLRFEKRGERTQMLTGVQEPPWRVIRAFQQANGGALVHLHNVSGGILAGDKLSLQVAVAPGAAAQVTTTGATRLYRHRAGAADSEQHTTLSVEEDGILEYLPDALIPFGGARHLQRTNVSLSENASFFGWDMTSPGRQAMGEQFAYESLRMEMTIRSGTRPLLIDSFHLEPKLRPLQTVARMGEYLYMASFYAVQIGRARRDLQDLEERCTCIAQEVSRPGDMLWGASTLASDGVIVRGLAKSARDLPATLARFWTTARRFLTGVDAVFPRKLK